MGPAPPIVFYEVLLALAPIPAALLARRTFAAPIPLRSGGLAFATVLLSLRNVIEASPIADRSLLLLQTMSVGVPVAVDLRRGRLAARVLALEPRHGARCRPRRRRRVGGDCLACLHRILRAGPIAARRIRQRPGVRTGVRCDSLALYGVVLALLGIPPLRWLRSARAADPALLRAVRWVLGLAAIGGVAIVTLGNLRLTAAALAAIDALMDSSLDVGALSISVTASQPSVGIALTDAGRDPVTEFVLDREVFPRLDLRPGTGYAIATFTRWIMIIVGTVLALAALGMDMTKVTLIAGALGVGIGFGCRTSSTTSCPA